jgi:hypothetical protein
MRHLYGKSVQRTLNRSEKLVELNSDFLDNALEFKEKQVSS